jgi:hypothetical protein
MLLAKLALEDWIAIGCGAAVLVLLARMSVIDQILKRREKKTSRDGVT